MTIPRTNLQLYTNKVLKFSIIFYQFGIGGVTTNEQRRRVKQMTARNARVRRERQNREKRIRRSMRQGALRELEDKVERQHKSILKQHRQLVTNKTKTSQRKGTCFILLFFFRFSIRAYYLAVYF